MTWLRRFMDRLGFAPAHPPVFLPHDIPLATLPSLLPPGFLYGVEIYNDDTTPMEFVVLSLGEHLGLSHAASVQAMMKIHRQGGALFATATYIEAQRIAEAITADASAHKHVLLCRPVSLAA